MESIPEPSLTASIREPISWLALLGVVGILCLLAVAQPPLSAAVVLGGVAAMLLLVSRPDLAFALYFAVQALFSEDILLITEKLAPTIYRENLPYIGFNGFEVALLFLVAATMLQRRGRLAATGLDFSILLFGLACLAGYLSCITLYHDPTRLFEPRRLLHFFVIYFLTVNLIRTRESLKVFLLLYFLAIVLKSCQGVYLFHMGEGLQVKWRIRAIFTGWGDSLNFVTYLLFLAVFFLDRLPFPARRLLLFCSPAVFYCFLFTYKRSYYVAMAAGLGVLFFLLHRRAKLRFLLLLLMGMVLVAGIITWAGQWQAITLRIASIFAPTKESSAQYRLIEYRNALISIHNHPFQGIGLGGVMPMVIYIPRTNLLGVHNTWLWVAVKMGMFGCFTYLLLNFLFLKQLVRQNTTLRDPFLRSVSRALTCAFLAFCTAQMFAPIFSQIRTATWMGVMLGIGMMLRNMDRDALSNRSSPGTSM